MVKNSDYDITALNIEQLKDMIRQNKDNMDSPIIIMAHIVLKLSLKQY